MVDFFAGESFAVVDLETTGTRKEEGDRIIQFGCAIVKDGEVVKTYSFMMNPHRKIPLAVTNLTGIDQKMVAGQADFKHYAPKIREILQDKVFVAHNVNFDFPFLNYELTNAGFEALTCKAVDTVELAKIAFPTLPSYKLRDLTASLEIKHANPHKADSDAYGTAVLLLKIIDKLASLPQATLNVLGSLASGLIRDTGDVIKVIADQSRQSRRKLPKDKMQVRNLVLKRQEIPAVEHGENGHFPVKDTDKRKLFKGKINYRQAQVDLIDRLHDFVEDAGQRVMLAEAPNGTGKTFAYLFAYAYQLYSGKKLVIATPTKVLQQQLLDQEIPQLLRVTGLGLNAEMVKSSSHYLDLDGFAQTLYQNSPNKATLLLQMQILVWLTETTTGDMDELQLTSQQLPIFNQLKHPGDARVASQFASVDFWNLARRRQEQANILVTNHAYLVNHYMDSIWGQNPYLVIDEAHRFSENLQTARMDSLRLEAIWGSLSHLRNLLYFTDNNLLRQSEENVQLQFMLDLLDQESLDLIHSLNRMQKYLYQHKGQAISQVVLPNKSLQLTIQGQDLFPENSQFRPLLRQFQQQLEQVRIHTNQIRYLLEQEKDRFLTDEESLLEELNDQVDLLEFYTGKSYQLSDLLNQPLLDHLGFVVNVTNSEDALNSNLHWLSLDSSEELHKIYDRFDHISMISATITNDGNFAFAKQFLALPNLGVSCYKGKASFPMADHLEILAMDEGQPEPDSPRFLEELKNILTKDLSGQKHVLCLFTNLDLIKQLYFELLNDPRVKDYELLAQGLTGSNERITRRFVIAERSILLGADSFWEGVDFHNCGIDLVIATRLPFESPDLPEVSLRQHYLAQRGWDVFQEDSLPRAVLRLRQGCGRLIRGEDDYGQFLILDPRIWTKSYGPAFRSSLPAPVQRVKASELKKKLKFERKNA
ncbi:ATP-dependent helicase [Lactobacillus delbrueckii]|uniref:helicase C-terminal domain-containing protein n=1 Tax=Lactobacillus delbrueckii TaxID=1584 RepID=UPI001F173CFD|nr:helicase C-terminal domain-containing protein [Lactobacillus delbrueckii]GHN63180.1 ATP-dependent helicase [Lactobacillus delbrueckii]